MITPSASEDLLRLVKRQKVSTDGSYSYQREQMDDDESSTTTFVPPITPPKRTPILNLDRPELIMSVASTLTNMPSCITAKNDEDDMNKKKDTLYEDDNGLTYDQDDDDSSSIGNDTRSNSNVDDDQENINNNNTNKGEAPKPPRKRGRRERAIRFPVKLMTVLSCGKYDGIISWTHDGTSFVVHSPKELVEKVFPYHFKEVKYPSFTRKVRSEKVQS